jgi:hypothetical protein
VAHQDAVVEPELPADRAHLVLEQVAQGLHQLQVHAGRKAADVVVCLDDGGGPLV